ncbi:MAG: class I SAM-dependent methyltransferase [Phycisphaerae bacterium]
MIRTGIGTRRGVRIALVVLAMAALPLLAGRVKEAELDVPYVPTHQKAVDEMLKVANVTSEDYLIDLGCGDGRIVVTAAKTYKTHGLGVDLNPRRVRESNRNAKKAKVTDLVEFRKEDIMVTDVRKASVVTLFLLESVNVRIRPKLFAQLKPGTRVVSNSFTMRDWKPDKEVRHPRAFSNVIYYWAIPAPVGGTWTWQNKLAAKDVPNTLKLEQEFQVVQGAVASAGGADVPIAEASLAGKELSFTVTLGKGKEQVVVAYRGTADGDALEGTQEWRGGPNAGTYPWVAKRKPVDLTGRWQVRAASHSDCNGTLHIQREAAGLKATYVRDDEPGKELPLHALYVWGSSIRFEVSAEGFPLAFSGSLGSEGGGSVSREQSQERTAWTAKRLAAGG